MVLRHLGQYVILVNQEAMQVVSRRNMFSWESNPLPCGPKQTSQTLQATAALNRSHSISGAIGTEHVRVWGNDPCFVSAPSLFVCFISRRWDKVESAARRDSTAVWELRGLQSQVSPSLILSSHGPWQVGFSCCCFTSEIGFQKILLNMFFSFAFA